MTWPLITFLAGWALSFCALTFMAAAIPSSVKTTNSDVLFIALLTGAVAGMTTLMLMGAVSIFQ